MKKTMISIRIDDKVKKQMQEVCKEYGITMSEAFNMFARKVCKDKNITLQYVDLYKSYDTWEDVEKRIKRIEEGKTKTEKHELVNV